MSTQQINRYGDADLQEFRELIDAKLTSAREQMDYFKSQLAASSDSPDAKVRGLEDGTNSMENEDLHNMAARQIKLIQHLENALIRIENKNYGICRQTGNLISKARLRAVPHATLSIAAKSARP